MSQIKYRFDKATLVKIGKGALISGVGAIGLFILSALGKIEISDPLIVSFIAWFIPVATNTIKEWVRGQGIEEE